MIDIDSLPIEGKKVFLSHYFDEFEEINQEDLKNYKKEFDKYVEVY